MHTGWRLGVTARNVAWWCRVRNVKFFKDGEIGSSYFCLLFFYSNARRTILSWCVACSLFHRFLIVQIYYTHFSSLVPFLRRRRLLGREYSKRKRIGEVETIQSTLFTQPVAELFFFFLSASPIQNKIARTNARSLAVNILLDRLDGTWFSVLLVPNERKERRSFAVLSSPRTVCFASSNCKLSFGWWKRLSRYSRQYNLSSTDDDDDTTFFLMNKL